MTEVEKSIAEALILIEAENEIDRLKAALSAKSVYCDILKQQRDELHQVATDLWLYGTSRAPASSKSWRDAVEKFEQTDQLIHNQG
jgi:hypothetical protein